MKLKTCIPTLALTALLVLSATPALASNIVSPSTAGTTDLCAQVDPTYTVVIPPSMTEDKTLKGGDDNNIGTLSAKDLNLAPGTSLKCTLQGDTLTRQGGAETLGYNAHFGTDKTAKTIILTENTQANVMVGIDSDSLKAAKAGTYKGTLNFDLTVVE